MTASHAARVYLSDGPTKPDVARVACDELAVWLHRAGNAVVGAPTTTRLAAVLGKLVTALVDVQARVFFEGLRALQPLTQRQLAERVGLNEALVSRLLGEVVLVYRDEEFPPTLLFSTALSRVDGTRCSAAQVQVATLRLLRDHPTASDEQLSRMLRTAGFEVARRTIAKYRDELAIPATFRRSADRAWLTPAVARIAPCAWLRVSLDLAPTG